MLRHAPPNFGVKLARPGFGPPAEPAPEPPASRRHGGCRSRLGSPNVMRGSRRAALSALHARPPPAVGRMQHNCASRPPGARSSRP